MTHAEAFLANPISVSAACLCMYVLEAMFTNISVFSVEEMKATDQLGSQRAETTFTETDNWVCHVALYKNCA